MTLQLGCLRQNTLPANDPFWLTKTCHSERGNLAIRGKIHQDHTALLDLIKSCGKRKDLQKGIRIHGDLLKGGLFRHDIYVNTALICMYSKCGDLLKAREVFDGLVERNVVSYNVLIAGYVQHGFDEEALQCFERMQDEMVLPNSGTLSCLLKACGNLRSIHKGEQVHSEVHKQHLSLRNQMLLKTALVDMYVKFGSMANARKVFDSLPVRDIVSWTALIAGYVEYGHDNEAFECFRQMQEEGHIPDQVLLVCVLKACSSLRFLSKGEAIHAKVVRSESLAKNTTLGTALIAMYAKCKALEKAHEVFDELQCQSVGSWNALIDGYAKHNLGDEAIKCFNIMRAHGSTPDAITFACILNVCSNIGFLGKGEELHGEAREKKLLEKDIVLGTALMNMYMKCGEVVKAHEVFDHLPEHNVVSWTTLLAGYAQLGAFKIVLILLNKMLVQGIVPDGITILVLLNACNHAGLVKEGQIYFHSMDSVYSLKPTLEHYTCMVDLFGRAGHFNKALLLIDKVVFTNRTQLLSALLSACQKWVNVEIGRWAFDHLTRLDSKNPASCVCMSNLYTAAKLP